MATDFLFYWMLQPSGLQAIGAAVALPFLVWRIVLGPAFGGVGFRPLAAGYVSAAVGLSLFAFSSSFIEFSSRVSDGLLEEARRWSMVPGWTVYFGVLSLIFVLPILALVGAPVSALLLRVRRLTYLNIALAVVVLWLAISILAWWSPLNDWEQANRLASFRMTLVEVLYWITSVAVPFIVGIRLSASNAR